MLKEVSNIKEVKLFSSELEEQNIENFKELLPYFYLNGKTNERILNSLNPDTRTSKDNSFDLYLSLNQQRRRWFKVDSTKIIDTDQSYIEYVYILNHYLEYGNSTLSRAEIRSYVNSYYLRDKEIYRSGKVIVDKQEYKLFKFLLKIKLFNQADVTHVSAFRPSNKSTYFCISRNPLDYLFCSTDQSFKSCESLKSSHSGAFYMGLGGLSLDPNRCIMFLTEGNVGNYTIKGLDFNHFRYSCRSWGIWLNSDQIYVIRYYPHELIPFNILLESIKIKAITKLRDDNYLSTHKFIIPRFQDDSKAFIFLDHIGLSHDESGHYYDSYNGSTGCISDQFNWDMGFEEISNWDELINGKEYECMNCGDEIPEEEMWTDGEGSTYCYNCYHERYLSCDNCGEETGRDNLRYCNDGNKAVCEHCFNEGGFECENCEDYYWGKDQFKLTDTDLIICEHCLDEYQYCEECETYYNNYCKNCTPYCQKCKTHYTDTCKCQLKLKGM